MHFYVRSMITDLFDVLKVSISGLQLKIIIIKVIFSTTNTRVLSLGRVFIWGKSQQVDRDFDQISNWNFGE